MLRHRPARSFSGPVLAGVVPAVRHCQTHRSKLVVQASSNGMQANSTNGSGSWAQAMASCNPSLCVPISVMTDSYKASHFLQYPASKKMVAVSTA